MPARPTRAPARTPVPGSARTARTRARVRLLVAAALLLTASAALTGCHDGEGVRDEGPSSVSSRSLGHPCGEQAPPPAAQRSFCAASVAQ
ncbi:hypothetical protein [Streptomyces naganishii]|uniref:hypothetical protein n=1 Tax=Streptomyces naganishii TaxID=285447 RepID=UPI00167EE547|nr:hypothetical protein [Streptomyces naganishii]